MNLICHCPDCSFNQDARCTASGKIMLNENGRCSEASRLANDKLEEILEFLERFGRYPFEEEKDRDFFGEILLDFPEVNVLEQLKRFQAWTFDLDDGRKINYRTTIRKWMKRTSDRTEKSQNGKAENGELFRVK